jgi:hypothetical protein
VSLLQKRDRAQAVERPAGAGATPRPTWTSAIVLRQRADRPEDADDRGVAENAAAVLAAPDVVTRSSSTMAMSTSARPRSQRRGHADAHVHARPVPGGPGGAAIVTVAFGDRAARRSACRIAAVSLPTASNCPSTTSCGV